MTLDETIRLNNLLDVYGVLLTQNQREVLFSYVSQNESLGEIAEENHTSRQAVSDLVMRSIKKLEDYESKLRFVDKLDNINKAIPLVANELIVDKSLAKKVALAYTDLIKSLED